MKNTTGIVRILFFTAGSNAQPEIFAHTLVNAGWKPEVNFRKVFFLQKIRPKTGYYCHKPRIYPHYWKYC